MIPFWVKWLVLAAVIGTIALAYNLHVNKLIKTAVDKAVTERDAEWRKSEQDAIAKANAAARAQEEAHGKALKALRTKYEKEVADAKSKADAAITAVHDGARLRIAAGCSSPADVPGASSGPAGSDGPAGAQFLGEADSAFLVGEAKRADEIARQLALCQATVTSDRSTP